MILADGRSLFVKTREHCPANMFVSEAKGLQWLRETETLRVPEVIGANQNFLALEFLNSTPRRTDFDQELGQGLAKMHAYPTDKIGLEYGNFIGPLPQQNQSCESWTEFYIERRLRPRLGEAKNAGRTPDDWTRRFERLFERLPGLIPSERPSRLHGDLWGGNIHVGPNGEPCLIDPSVYVGHREVDLAMMKLFGGFSSTVFDAYEESWPLQDGHAERVALYQLYPLLVHVVLFGQSYTNSVSQILNRYT